MTAQRLLYSLLLLVPVAVWLQLSHASPVPIFIVSCLAILPLAGLMGEATEHLAHHAGPGLGGLLNATFGNAAELIIGFHRAPSVRDRDRQGVSDRVDPGQPAHGAWAGDAGRRMEIQEARVQPTGRRDGQRHDGAGGRRAGDSRYLRTGHRAPKPRAHRGVEPGHLVRAHRDVHREPDLPVPDARAAICAREEQ